MTDIKAIVVVEASDMEALATALYRLNQQRGITSAMVLGKPQAAAPAEEAA